MSIYYIDFLYLIFIINDIICVNNRLVSLEQQNIFSPRKDELIFEYVRKQYINSRIQNILNDKSIINEEELIAFIKVHIKDTYNYLKKVYKEEMWIDVPPPKLVLFDWDWTISWCGPIKKSNWPVYCWVDGNFGQITRHDVMSKIFLILVY